MPRRIDTTSLVEQARDSILEAILGGEFAEKLPSEEHLTEMLNVSRTTIRAAIQGLESEGLLSRRRSAGTTIHRQGLSALALRHLIGFDQLLRGMGYAVEVEIDWERAFPPNFAGGTPAGWAAVEDAVVLTKQYRADGRLAIMITDVVPWTELAKVPRPTSRIPASLFDFSVKFCRRPIERANVGIVPMVMTDEATSALALPVGTPFLRLHETHNARESVAVAWSVIDINDDLVRLEIARG